MTDTLQAVAIPLSKIVAGLNDRSIFDPDDSQSLADDIQKNGLHNPITVRPLRLRKGQYEIVAGERRFRAHELLGKPTIMAYIRDLTDEQADAVMLSENLMRVDLDPIDEAKAIQKRIDRYDWSIAEAARQLSVGEGRIKNRLALLKLRKDVQYLVSTEQFPLGHAEVMQNLDSDYQTVAMRAYRDASRPPTRREFAAYCGELESQQNQAALFDLSAFMVESAELPSLSLPSRSRFGFTLWGIDIDITITHKPGAFKALAWLGGLLNEA